MFYSSVKGQFCQSSMGSKHIYFSGCYMTPKSYLFKCSSNLLYLKKSLLSVCSINYRRIWISIWLLIFFSFRFAGFLFKYSTLFHLVVTQTVKNLPAMQETQIWYLGQEHPLEKRMATHSSILAWSIPWIEEPGRLQSMWSQRVGHNWATKHAHTQI